MLEDSFGKEFFQMDITERIKTYEDTCEYLGINPKDLPNVGCCQDEDQRSIIAYHKLIIIARALNECWRPDWKDSRQCKYVPYFNETPSSFVCGGTYCWYSNANAGSGSRLCYKTRALAEYAGRQFIDLYKDLILFT